MITTHPGTENTVGPLHYANTVEKVFDELWLKFKQSTPPRFAIAECCAKHNISNERICKIGGWYQTFVVQD